MCKDKWNALKFYFFKFMNYHKMIKIHTYFWDLSCEEKKRFHLPHQFNKAFQGEKVINVPMHVRGMNAKGDVVYKQLAQETQDENEDFQLQDNVQKAPNLIANSQGTQMLGFVNLSKVRNLFQTLTTNLLFTLLLLITFFNTHT
jgi:hypothetical protein